MFHLIMDTIVSLKCSQCVLYVEIQSLFLNRTNKGKLMLFLEINLNQNKSDATEIKFGKNES